MSLRNISNISHGVSPSEAPNQDLSPRETPRLHLRSLSSRIPSCLWFGNETGTSAQLAEKCNGSKTFGTSQQRNGMSQNWEIIRQDEGGQDAADMPPQAAHNEHRQSKELPMPEQVRLW